MAAHHRGVSRSVGLSPFLLAAVLFLMPWVEVSCSGVRVLRLSGAQLAIGTTVQDPMGGRAGSRFPVTGARPARSS